MRDCSLFVSDLLDDGIHVLIYAGDVDCMCNYMGNKAWTSALDWKHKDEFNKSEDHVWGTCTGENSVGTCAGGHFFAKYMMRAILFPKIRQRLPLI